MQTKFDRYTLLAARILLSLIFVVAGIDKIFNWEGMAQFMASKGMPVAFFFLAGAIVVEVFGGLSLLLGVKARIGAWALFLFLIPTTLIFQNFWSGGSLMGQILEFLKNLSIMGGLLAVAIAGPGAWSFDSPRENA